MMKLPVFPLLYTEMVFVKGPGRPAGSKVTLIWAFLPGATGSFGHSGVVHPQDAITRVMTRGISPVLDTSNDKMKQIVFIFMAILLATGMASAQKKAVISAETTSFDFGTIKEADGKVSQRFLRTDTAE